jgi:hypothetical protein
MLNLRIVSSCMLFSALGLVSTASANLLLTVDVPSETVTLSGSDSGNLAAVDAIGEVSWAVSGEGAGSSDQLSADDLSTTSPSLTVFTSLNVGSTGALSLDLFYPSGGSSFVTITGTGVGVSYAGLADQYKDGLESLSGDLTVAKGTGFSSISTLVVIPEPSACGWLIGVAMFASVLFRRR